VVGADAERADFLDHRVAHRVGGGGGDVRDVLSVVGERDGDVRLRAAEGRDQTVRLEEHLVFGRREAQHNLSERDESGHSLYLLNDI